MWLDDAKAHFISCWPNEGVGYVKHGVFTAVQNTAPDPRRSFHCDPNILLQEPELLIHSHTVGWEVINYDPREPSELDLVGQLQTGVEWAICVTDGQSCDDPLYWGNPDNRPPLIGRDFIYNLQDCFALAQDYYWQAHRILLRNVPRQAFWNFEGQDHIMQNFVALGFSQININDARPGDALLYKVRSPVVNHIGVLTPEGVLSHWTNRVSQVEDYGKWARYIVAALRHKELT